ncbi:MAG: alpha/beta hydrolase [Thioalkalivibrio sp.]|nr:alpha/beta hydrolase [Thioalkalivibrio sp.]
MPLAPGEVSLSRSAASTALRNPDIDPRDTHFAALVRTRTTFQDGGEGAGQIGITAILHEEENESYVEGGYDTGGDLLFGVHWDDYSASPHIGSIRTWGDYITVYDPWGYSLDDGSGDGTGGGGDGGGDDCLDCVIEPYNADRVQVTRTEDGDWREVTIVLSPSGSMQTAAADADRIETVRRYRRWARGAGLDEERRRSAMRAAAEGREDPARSPAAAEPVELIQTADLTTLSDCGRGSSRTDRTVVTGGSAVLYQHGICSEAATWDGMRPRVASVLNVGRERAFSLTSTARYETQVDELEQEIGASGDGSSIVVSHSQGGLVARRLGQRRGDLVGGVITIGTPHQGALIADYGPDLVADKVTQAVGSYCVGSLMCQLLNEILTRKAVGEITYGLAGTAVPVIQDVRTGSAFLGTLNNTYEPFLRAGIESDAGNRWALMRLAGDVVSERTRLAQGLRPYGPQWVDNTEYLYRAGWALQYMGMFMWWYATPYGGGVGCGYSYYRDYWDPCWDPYYYDYWYTYSYWYYIANLLYTVGSFVTTTLDQIDWTWDDITTRRADLTDGFIQFNSQRYPWSPGSSGPLRYVIRAPYADSHTGSTASPEVYSRVEDSLRRMGVPTR